MTISYLNETIPKIYCFIFYKYSDIISYKRIFSYIRNNFQFISDIIHTDYEKSLYNIFIKENIFNKKIL